MSASITVRDIDPGDGPWLGREGRQVGVSIEEPVHERPVKSERRPKPPEIFARRFGMEHGVELRPLVRCDHEPPSFSGGGEE